MKCDVIPYKPEHIEWIITNYPRSRELYWCKLDDWKNWPNQWQEMGPCYSLTIDSKIIMSAGVMILREGFGEAWMVLSELFYKYKKECFKAVRDKLDEIIMQKKLRRVQAFVMTDFKEAEHWLTHLSFQNESPTERGLRCFGQAGDDMFIYSRITRFS